MWHRAERSRAFTLVETLIGLTLMLLIVGAVAESFVVTARAMTAVTEQMRRQTQTGLALDRCAEILRNARYPVTLTSATDVRFEDVRNPGDTARIWLSGTRLMYDPNIGDATAGRALAAGLSGLTISSDPDPLVGDSALLLRVSYNYGSFRDYHPNQSRNATFVTSVFLRNFQE